MFTNEGKKVKIYLEVMILNLKLFGREISIKPIYLLVGILCAIIIFAFFVPANKAIIIEGNVSATKKPVETPSSMIKVYICGEVIHPGVYSVTQGTIVFDALKLAGGITSKGSKAFNLAWQIQENLMLRIPSKRATIDFPIVTTGIDFENLPVIEQPKNSALNNISKININSASANQLMELPGVGESTANKIISYRNENRFDKIEDIMNVAGIGEKKFEDMKEYISTK